MDAHARHRWMTLTIVLCGLLTLSTMASAQARKPLTSADLTQMKTAGFDDQTIINAINANGVSIDTSVQGLLALKQSGLSEKVIDAALTAAAPKPVASSATSVDKGIPEDIGAYAIVNGTLTPLPVEVVNFKTGGMLGTMLTDGIKKAKFQGTVPGDRSSEQLTVPVTIVLRCADGTAPTEYQLIQLDTKKNRREFTESKVGVLGASGGVDNQAIAINFQRVGHDTYKGVIPNLRSGQYGFLAPGAFASANGASTGKLYTFGILE